MAEGKICTYPKGNVNSVALQFEFGSPFPRPGYLIITPHAHLPEIYEEAETIYILFIYLKTKKCYY